MSNIHFSQQHSLDTKIVLIGPFSSRIAISNEGIAPTCLPLNLLIFRLLTGKKKKKKKKSRILPKKGTR
jgi:hypothetical protein